MAESCEVSICSCTDGSRRLTSLTGSLSVSVADSCYITCPKTGLKVILEYQEEGWLGRSQNLVKGVIFKYDPKNDNLTKIKDVPDKEILARIEGAWTDKVYYTLGNKPFNKAGVSVESHMHKQQRTNNLTGEAPHHRPQPALPSSQDRPSYGRTAPQRIP